MKSSFADADQENVAPAPANATQATAEDSRLAAPPSGEMVTDNFFENEGVEGDFDRSDIKMPRLALVANTGALSGELGFTPGHFVYNKEASLGATAKATLLKIKKYLLEDLPYDPSGSGPIPMYFKTIEDARKAGFLPVQEKKNYSKEQQKELKFAKPVLDADLLIEGDPKNEKHVAFPFDYNGTPFAVARWTLQSTAYSRVGKQFFTDSQLALKACGLTGKYYALTAKKEKLNDNWVWVPKAALAGRNSDEFVAWIKATVR